MAGGLHRALGAGPKLRGTAPLAHRFTPQALGGRRDPVLLPPRHTNPRVANRTQAATGPRGRGRALHTRGRSQSRVTGLARAGDSQMWALERLTPLHPASPQSQASLAAATGGHPHLSLDGWPGPHARRGFPHPERFLPDSWGPPTGVSQGQLCWGRSEDGTNQKRPQDRREPRPEATRPPRAPGPPPAGRGDRPLGPPAPCRSDRKGSSHRHRKARSFSPSATSVLGKERCVLFDF